MFLVPRPSSSRIIWRSWTQPSPSVILPLTSMTVTESTCRVVAFMLTVRSSLIGLQIGVELLDHGDFGPDSRTAVHVKLIHESADQKNPPARYLQQILRGQRVGDVAGVKTVSLVADVNLQPVAINLIAQIDLLGLVVLVAVVDRVDQRFVHGHLDSLPLVLVKPRCGGYPPRDLVGDLHLS